MCFLYRCLINKPAERSRSLTIVKHQRMRHFDSAQCAFYSGIQLLSRLSAVEALRSLSFNEWDISTPLMCFLYRCLINKPAERSRSLTVVKHQRMRHCEAAQRTYILRTTLLLIHKLFGSQIVLRFKTFAKVSL